jgi:hypothetical protein
MRFERARPGRLVNGRCRKPTRRNLRRRRCTRYVAVRRRLLTFTFNSAGRHRVRFGGRVSRRSRLAPGRYRLVLGARDGDGLRSRPARGRFRLLPAARHR